MDVRRRKNKGEVLCVVLCYYTGRRTCPWGVRLGTKRHDIGSLSFFSAGGGFRAAAGSDGSATRVGGGGGVLARSVVVDGGRRGGFAG